MRGRYAEQSRGVRGRLGPQPLPRHGRGRLEPAVAPCRKRVASALHPPAAQGGPDTRAPAFLAFRRAWQREAVSRMMRRKKEGLPRTRWLNGSCSTHAWNLGAGGASGRGVSCGRARGPVHTTTRQAPRPARASGSSLEQRATCPVAHHHLAEMGGNFPGRGAGGGAGNVGPGPGVWATPHPVLKDAAGCRVGRGLHCWTLHRPMTPAPASAQKR